MTATAQKLKITKEDFAGGGGAHAELPVPADYEAELTDVEDYDYTDRGKTKGWKFFISVETPTGNVAVFKKHASFSANSRGVLADNLTALGADLEEGINNVDPNALVGLQKFGVSIDFPRDDDGEPTSKYREIQEIFSLVEAPPVSAVGPDMAEEPQVI